jgi:hypothetical protein
MPLAMRLSSRWTLGLAALGLAVPAAAQNGAMWVDPYGRMLSMQFAGGNGAPPVPHDRSATEMARLFKSICLGDGGFDAAATAAGLTGDPITFPAGKKAPPLVLNLWKGEGLVVSQTGGFFAAPNAQCNSVFYVTALPLQQEVMDALTAAIGAPPSNLAAAADKSGKPKKYYSPEWKLDGPDGGRIVTAFVQKGDQSMPGARVHISVRAAKKAAK